MLPGTDAALLFEDLRLRGPQYSWDWRADLRFALAVGLSREAGRIQEIADSPDPLPKKYDAYRREIRRAVTDRRLRAMNKLAKAGVVGSEWAGLGFVSFSEFGGARRNKTYWLRGQRPDLARDDQPVAEFAPGC